MDCFSLDLFEVEVQLDHFADDPDFSYEVRASITEPGGSRNQSLRDYIYYAGGSARLDYPFDFLGAPDPVAGTYFINVEVDGFTIASGSFTIN